jgi:hypothetical protein
MSATATKSLVAEDLFVVLERAYRKKARDCATCGFSLPFHTDTPEAHDANWSVVPSSGCCGMCLLILEDVISQTQASYRLAA